MLKDSSRNKAYRQAIFDNVDQIKGRVVLDVGAGTGILSVYCAQAGAARVYAVEASNVFKIAQEIVKENHLDQIVQVINSRIEDAILPEKVDIIVSEWMGFYLLHEAMLDSIITARDKFLKPGGLIFPESATLYSAPCSVPSMFEFWHDVDGVSMGRFGARLRSEAAHRPITAPVAPEDVLADPEIVVWIDLREVTSEDVSSVKIRHVAVANRPGKYQGICLWFTCTFPSFSAEPVSLSTAPEEPETHWKQTTIVLPNELQVEERAPIAYELTLARSSESARRYNIEVAMLDPDEVEHPEYCNCHMTKCILVRAMLEKYEMESLPK
ncbi:protein arginine N-methyltransferase 6 [Asbolus verrucosus]|uniref:Protein arginine N-methyltransferase 6 n=1 Tax=Asbolus verrucosus TaxID=1661398 RepID=A0A482V8N3_ASBVE|nr:protein arginine N-methyltransferase 6 [Asbolus verrucosus]